MNFSYFNLAVIIMAKGRLLHGFDGRLAALMISAVVLCGDLQNQEALLPS